MNVNIPFIGFIVAVIVLALILFPGVFKKIHILLKGFGNNFVMDISKTPEGAEAIYTQAIDSYEKDYRKVNNILREKSGQLETEKINLNKLNERLKKIEADCEALVKAGKYQRAEDLSYEREELLIDIRTSQQQIDKLEAETKEAQFLNDQFQKKLRQAKLKKKQVVSDLKMNQESEKMYDDFDDLKNTSELDKLLAAVEEGHKDSVSRSIGAKTVYENQVSTKANRAHDEAKKLQTSSYIEDLKKKYNK